MIKKLSLMMLTILSGFFIISNAYAAAAVDCTDIATCDQETFTSVAPDALIVLDLSANMNRNPGGGASTYGNSIACTQNAACSAIVPGDPNSGYSATSITGCATPCSRLDIAKRAIFDILDDDNNNVIDNSDANSLGIRFGFMRFQNGEYSATDITANYNAGSVKLIKPIATSYQNIYCGAAASNGSCTPSDTCASGECIANETASGGSSLARALIEAKLYLNANKLADTTAGDCRQKFAILITTSSDDCYLVGSDSAEPTSQCIGECTDGSPNSATRRRQTVLETKALYDAGYKVYTVGFGESMPGYLKNTLNWMARYGGTDNPTMANSGNPNAYNPANSVGNKDVNLPITCGVPPVSVINWFAKTNDPGYSADPAAASTTSYPLSGYAFIAENAIDLSYSLKSAIASIRDQTYSFTRVSVQTVRTPDENYIYEASFAPLLETTDKDPFWIGHLKKYSLLDNGNLDQVLWDAGELLKARSTARTIYTYKGGSTLTVFNDANITSTDLNLNDIVDTTLREATRIGIINFIHNGDELYPTGDAKDNWKLGDIFHSSPISIGTPSVFFSDQVDQSSPTGYKTYQLAEANQRTSANGKRLIVAGANDGQFHAFRTSTGAELWSFIPPNLLGRLKYIYHDTHLSSQSHQYYVDGPATASDVWTGTGDGTAKTDAQWKAYMIISEGRGGSSALWCSSASCDSGCNDTYDSTVSRTQYCGYYAFDVTDTLRTNAAGNYEPLFLWHFGGTGGLNTARGDHLGQPWSKITMGRVKISGNERWVGFAAGGYAGADCKGGGACDKRGKGFYVIDLMNGNILWSYTHSGPAGTNDVVNANMDYSLVGQPASVDLDDDGFIDTVYSADLGGNVWRFKFCSKADLISDATCSQSSWTAGLFFATASGNIRPIYTKPTVVHTTGGDVWVYFGSGDLNDPTASNAQERMYAVKDNLPRTATYEINNLSLLGANQIFNPNDCGTKCQGWFILLTGSGQKILADPTVYADVVYFTSYNPSSSTNVCAAGGAASLYAIDYITGAGEYAGGARSTSAGTGIASGAVVSENPSGGTNIYVTTSEGARINPVSPPDPFANKANLQYWHDMRVK